MIAQAPFYQPSRWRADRLLLACRIRGCATPPLLRAKINEGRGATSRAPIGLSTAHRWLTGSVNPAIARAGHVPAVFEIADALQVSVDWLCNRVKREPAFTEHTRRKFAGDEGWS